MNIVIPANNLARTIITVRCDMPHAPPQIEFGVDGKPLFASGSQETYIPPLGSPVVDGRYSTSNKVSSSVPSGSDTMGRTDLSVERGMDHRGHFVRLSFLELACRQQPFDHRKPDAGSYAHEGDFTGPTQGLGLFPEPSPFSSATMASPASISSRHLPYYPVPSAIIDRGELIAGSSSQQDTGPDTPPCQGNLDFISPPGSSELMTALDSFMGMLDAGVPENVVHTSLTSKVTSPETRPTSVSPPSSLSPSLSSEYWSPPSTATFSDTGEGNGTGTGCSNNASDLQRSAEHYLQSSPELPPLSLSPAQCTFLQGNAESRLLPCLQPGCKRRFKSTFTRGRHMQTHFGKGIKFTCSFPSCTEKFSRRHDKLRHEVYKHGKQCEWVCERCNSFFSYERSLEKHTCTTDKSRRGSLLKS